MNNETLKDAIEQAARIRGFTCGEIGLRLTDDHSIHQINLLHLKHDYPTDVISYGYDAQVPVIDGEMVVSVDTARRVAGQIGWSVANELTLYVVHGTLHLTGMDDQQPGNRVAMREMEVKVLSSLGIEMSDRFGPDDDTRLQPTADPGTVNDSDELQRETQS